MNIIPMPKKVSLREDTLCIKPLYTTDCEAFLPTLHAFSELCDRLFGLALSPLDAAMPDSALMTPLTEEQLNTDKIKKEDEGEKRLVALEGEESCDGGFFIKRDSSLESGEYRLVTEKSCVVYALDTAGLANALSTMLQLAGRTCDKYIKLPKGEIWDRPDNTWRSLMLDVARKWHPVDYLYRYVELCHLLKINRFVIHFTDDESFTLPLECLPRLATENRHYKKSELRALCEYAASLGVMIVPEVDMPGHSAQFQLKYPEIFGNFGIMEASEETFSALEKIYKETSELFSESDYIHIGGDEAVLGRWGDSEKTKAYMEENNIEDFSMLYGHYVGRIADFVLSLGKTPVVWEGFGKRSARFVPKETLVAEFESHYQTAPELIEDGFTLINASWRPIYIVAPWQKWSAKEILEWDKYTFDHWWEGSKAFNRGVIAEKGSPICGGMICAWGDYLKGYESCRLASSLEFACVMPRLSALSERVWNDAAGHTEESFLASYEEFKKKISVIFGENPFRGEL